MSKTDLFDQRIEERETKEKITITAKELYESNIPKQEWIVDRLVPAKSLTVLAGEPGSFKSYIVLYLTLCCASGKKFLNHETKQGKTLYIDEENNEIVLKDRLELLSAGMKFSLEDLDKVVLTINKGLKIDGAHAKQLRKIIIREKPSLIDRKSVV